MKYGAAEPSVPVLTIGFENGFGIGRIEFHFL